MSLHNPSLLSPEQQSFMSGYLDSLALVERLHRLLLDVIKDEFERLGVLEINAVQALLLFNIGDNEVHGSALFEIADQCQHAGEGFYLKVLLPQNLTGSKQLSRFIVDHQYFSLFLFKISVQ